ncbi:MAG: 3'-5' exonuclease [Solirubrobacterales bacterium]|nr:3'-5' exonuclease [Solirubrobacterales bacterium]
MNWYDGRLAAFDIETTGTDIESDRIVTAAVSIVGGGEDAVSRSWLVNPGVPIPAEATEVHKITNEMVLSDGIPAAEAVEEITAILAEALAGETPVIAFNGRFDLTILDREARRHGVLPLIDRVGGSDGLLVIDPYVLDKQVNRFRKGRRNLSQLCEAYNVPLDGAHDADADALGAARLAWRMGRTYPELGELDIFELHEEQIGWAMEQAESLERYFTEQGRPERVEGAWPVVPVGHPVAAEDRLAA